MASRLLHFAISPLATVLGAFDKPKTPKPVLPQPQITPRSNSVLADALASRTGSADNRRTGARGAESNASSKNTLMGQ